MQNKFDLIRTDGLYAYTFIRTSSINATVSGTYLDQWGVPVLTHYYTITAGVSGLVSLYRDKMGVSTLDLPLNAYCLVVDVVTGALSIGFDGDARGGIKGTGVLRMPMTQYQTVRLGPKPVRGDANNIQEQGVYSTVLTFDTVTLTTTATQVVAKAHPARRSIQINNTSTSAYVYLGYDSLTDSSSRFIVRIDPTTNKEIVAGPGVDIWAVSSAASSIVAVAEVS